MTLIVPPGLLVAETITRRQGKALPTDRWAYKLAGNQYAIDTVINDAPDIDERKMAVTVVYADGNRRDGVGDLLDVGGILLDRHRKNAIGLFDHGKQVVFPIAKSEDPDTGEYTNYPDQHDQVARARAFFYRGDGSAPGLGADEYDHARFCEQVFDLMAQKFIRGGSIGYQVVQAKSLDPDYRTGLPAGLHLQKVLMLEFSVVVMPANMDTVRKTLNGDYDCRADYDYVNEILSMPRICGAAPCAYLVKSLTPYAPPRTAQLGYEADRVKVPHGDHTKTDVPPARWKPGAGAEKTMSAMAEGAGGALVAPPAYMGPKPEKKVVWRPDDDEEKPDGCTCKGYPRVKMRNGSGHEVSCPYHKSWQAQGGFSRKKDLLPGGRADGRRPEDFSHHELELGVRHELEHTHDVAKATEIAMDHLAEDPHYYTNLKRAGVKAVVNVVTTPPPPAPVVKGKSLPWHLRFVKSRFIPTHKIKPRKARGGGPEARTGGSNWFTMCPRDATGHCLPKSTGDEEGGGRKKGPGKGKGPDREEGGGEGAADKPAPPPKVKRTTVYATRLIKTPAGHTFARRGAELQLLRPGEHAHKVKNRHGAVLLVPAHAVTPHEPPPGPPAGAKALTGARPGRRKTIPTGENMTKQLEAKTKAVPPEVPEPPGPPPGRGAPPGGPALSAPGPGGPPPGPGAAPPPPGPDAGPTPGPEGAPPPADGFDDEPFSAQLLRHVHATKAQLLHDYDRMLRHLEQPKIKAFLQKLLQGYAAVMDEVEQLMLSEHPGSSPFESEAPPVAGLEGGLPEEEGLEGEGAPPEGAEGELPEGEGAEGEVSPREGEEPPPVEGEEPGDAEQDKLEEEQGMSGDAVPAPGEDEELPDEDDVAEVMAEEPSKKRTKSLRARYGSKVLKNGIQHRGVCRACAAEGKRSCMCGLKKQRKDLDAPAAPAAPAAKAVAVDATPGIPGVPGPKGELDDQEREVATEAAGFLKKASAQHDWTDEHRKHSFHYHKTLDGIARLGAIRKRLEEPAAAPADLAVGEPGSKGHQPSDDISPEKARQMLADGTAHGKPLTEKQRRMLGAAAGRGEKCAFVGDTGYWAEEAGEAEHDLHPHRKACKEVSGLFRQLSDEYAFGEPHRQKCMLAHKALADITSPKEEQAENKPVEGGPPAEHTPDFEPGDLGEKDLAPADVMLLRTALERQLEEQEVMRRQLDEIANRF